MEPQHDFRPEMLDREETGGEGKGPFRIACLGLILASLVYGAPLLFHPENHGRRDWDQFSFRYETARLALLRDAQLPLWNPYVNGGNVLLAHPHCPALSPWFVIVLALGAPIGLRIQVIVFLVLGTTGMACLLRQLRVSALGAFVGGIIFMMSSHFALHIAEGHLEWCVLGLMPWMLTLLLKMDRGTGYIVAAALLLASVLLFGSVYIPALFLPFFSLWAVLESMRRRRWQVAAGWAAVVVVAAMLSAVKLVPQVEFSSGGPPREAPAAGFSPRGLGTVFFDPRQVLYYRATRVTRLPIPESLGFLNKLPDHEAVAQTYRLAGKGFGFEVDWHEFGCYPTILGMLLALGGCIVSWRQNWPIFAAAAVCLNTMLGNGSIIDTWSLVQKLPLYGSLSAPSRFGAVLIFAVAIGAGFGFDRIVEFSKKLLTGMLPAALKAGIPIAIFAELLVLGWSLFGDVFVCERDLMAREGLVPGKHKEFAVRIGRARTLFPIMSTSMMPYLQGNSGMLDEYENVAVPRGNVRAVFMPGYRGEAYLAGSAGPVEITDWTMARVRVRLAPVGPDVLVLNQNFSKGWQATIGGREGSRATAAAPNGENLVAVNVGPGDESVIFQYRPSSVPWGFAVSAAALAGCLALLWAGSLADSSLARGVNRAPTGS